MTQPNPRLSSLFALEYPQSVGIYDTYEQAQAAVDYLADQRFAVQNLAIVGTDLKSVERVTGRRNWGTVMVSGVQSGISTGLMVAFILWFLQPQTNPLVLLPGALLIGIMIGIVFAAIAYASSRGKRDFNSISQTFAAHYEVLCEHKVAGQAREFLAAMPGARAAAFDPRNQGGWPQPQAQYPQQQYPQQQYPQQQYPQQQYPQAPQPGTHPGQPQAYGQAPAPYSQAPSQVYGQAPAQPYGQPSTPAGQDQPQAGQQPYGSYGGAEGLGQAPSGTPSDGRPETSSDSETDSDSEGRTPRTES